MTALAGCMAYFLTTQKPPFSGRQISNWAFVGIQVFDPIYFLFTKIFIGFLLFCDSYGKLSSQLKGSLTFKLLVSKCFTMRELNFGSCYIGHVYPGYIGYIQANIFYSGCTNLLPFTRVQLYRLIQGYNFCSFLR